MLFTNLHKISVRTAKRYRIGKLRNNTIAEELYTGNYSNANTLVHCHREKYLLSYLIYHFHLPLCFILPCQVNFPQNCQKLIKR